MAQNVVIVGGGVIGTATAFYAQSRGAQVTLIDGGGARATDASFGWINASFYLNEDHFRLRAAGMEAYQRLSRDLDLPLVQCGCLSWEFEGDALAQVHAALTALDYPVQRIDAAETRALEPALTGIPDEGLLFRTEAVAEPSLLVSTLQSAALAKGAQVIKGVHVLSLITQGDGVTGVNTSAGPIMADTVVVAAGIGSTTLMATAGITIPMVPRPAYVLETPPQPPLLRHVLATTGGEVRQRPDGALVMPTSAAHHRDDASVLEDTPRQAADAAMARLQRVLPSAGDRWAQVSLAHRPMPADGLPVIGTAAPGLYVTTMHSGLTLAAITGDLAAQEICDGPGNASQSLLSSFRPDRFADG